MALIFFGESICPLCNLIILESDEATGFRPFVINTLDPLYMFTDGGFHTSCAERHPLYQKARTLSGLLDIGNRKCVVDGGEIDGEKGERCFQAPIFCSDEQHPLYKFNGICVRSDNMVLWKERTILKQLLEKAIEKGDWLELDGENRAIKSYIGQL